MFGKIKPIFIGLAAGAVTGILGSGGGTLLVPMLSYAFRNDPKSLFPTALAVMLPIGAASLTQAWGSVSPRSSVPYLLGGFFGGLAAALWGKHIPVQWLHRIFGFITVLGGIRCLFPSVF